MPYPLAGTGVDGQAFAAIQEGPFRADRDTAALPASGQAAIFTVTGGRVRIWLLGEVTTVIQTQACNLSVIHNPASGTDAALCAVLNVSADEVGTLYGLTGVPADALLGGGQFVRDGVGVKVKPGTIDLLTSATNTGSVKWTCFWAPIDEGASVAAA